jgi:type II secretory pathway component GspD/PulD (secretin)
MKQKNSLLLIFIFSATLLFAGGHWNNDKLFFRTSVNESVVDILTAIAIQNHSQIIFDKGIEATETLTIEEMPLEGAFNLILQRNNLEYKWEGNTIIVNSIKNTQLKKEFLILENITIDKLISLLKRYNIYTKIKNKVKFDSEMNAVYIEAQAQVVEDFKNIIEQFEMAEKLLQKRRVQKAKNDIEYKKLEFIKQKHKIEANKKKKFGLNEFEQWRMKIDIVPLKYINVSSTEIEFQGEKIKVESLEDTLKGLLGTGYVSRNKKDDNLSFAIQNNYEESYLKMDARTNSIIIKDYPDRIAEIKEIIKKLDTPTKLVEIEVTIATGETGFTNSLGMALGGISSSGSTEYGLSTSSKISSNLNSIKKGTNVDLLQPSGALGLSGSMLFTGSKSLINTQLNLMETDGSGKVLSNPKIVTLNNREATIVSGNSISIPVSTSDKIGLETVETGISIKATPHIIEKKGDSQKDIMLDISIESSSLGDTSQGQINKSTNKINTNVIMRNGQTLILGGLFQYTKKNTDIGVPGLKDIPFLGFLFSTKTKQLNKNELVFFITPRIVTSGTIKNKFKTHYQKSLIKSKNEFNNYFINREKNKKKIEEKNKRLHKKRLKEVFKI